MSVEDIFFSRKEEMSEYRFQLWLFAHMIDYSSFTVTKHRQCK